MGEVEINPVKPVTMETQSPLQSIGQRMESATPENWMEELHEAFQHVKKLVTDSSGTK